MGQILAVSLLIYFSNIRLVSFGDLLGGGELLVPGYWFSVAITIFCLLGVINSVNLIDGLDGLAGGISFVAFLILAAHASFAGNQMFLLLNLAFAGATLGFLRYNWYPAKLFMGDAGSLSLGFTLAFMALGMTQGEKACMPPIAALLILAVPITDTLTVMTKRIIQGQSPFHPDKCHLHHIFMRHGFGRETTVKIIISLSIIFGCISIAGPIYQLTESTLFLIFVIYLVSYFIASFFILDLLRYSFRFHKNRDSYGVPSKFLANLFRLLDTLNIIRSDTRYHVSVPMHCYTSKKEKPLKGTITNISKSGFMASIPKLETLESTFFTEILLDTTEYPSSLPATEVSTEHLWIATRDGTHIHGFRFRELTPQQKTVIDQIITMQKELQSLNQQRAFPQTGPSTHGYCREDGL